MSSFFSEFFKISFSLCFSIQLRISAHYILWSYKKRDGSLRPAIIPKYRLLFVEGLELFDDLCSHLIVILFLFRIVGNRSIIIYHHILAVV